MAFLRPTRRANPFAQPFAQGAPIYSSGSTYQSAIAAIPNVLAIWPLTDASGTSAVEVISGYNGTYGGSPTLNAVTGAGASMGNAVSFNSPASQYVSLAAATINSVWNSAEGALACWGKVTSGSTWSSATQYPLLGMGADNNWRMVSFTNYPTVGSWAQVGATGSFVLLTGTPTTTTAWFHAAFTWSRSANTSKAYFNGALFGTGTWGAWSGALAETYTRVGSGAQSGAGWPGAAQFVALYTRALNSTEITTLATAL